MITSKVFESQRKLNEFVNNNFIENIEIINIETVKVMEDTGLPLPHGGTFKSESDYYKLWYYDKTVVKQSDWNGKEL